MSFGGKEDKKKEKKASKEEELQKTKQEFQMIEQMMQ